MFLIYCPSARRNALWFLHLRIRQMLLYLSIQSLHLSVFVVSENQAYAIFHVLSVESQDKVKLHVSANYCLEQAFGFPIMSKMIPWRFWNGVKYVYFLY